MSDLVQNLKDRFSLDAAQIYISLCQLFTCTAKDIEGVDFIFMPENYSGKVHEKKMKIA